MAKKKEELASNEEVQVVESDAIFGEELDNALDASLSVESPEVSAEDVAELDGNVEEVETVARPQGRGVARRVVAQSTEVAQPAPAGSRRRNASEMRRSEEEWEAERNQRQDDVIAVARYLTAAKRNNVMSGRIAGVEAKNGHVFWTIYDGPVIVYIPFHEALPFLPNNMFDEVEDKERIVRQKQMMTKSIGATVPFSVEAVEPDGDVYLVYGSRKVALQRISRRYFGHNAANPVLVGDDVVGHILAVGAHAAWINVNGVDVRMSPDQMSHRYLKDLQKNYSAGDEIKLRVEDLRYDENGKVLLALSGRPCEVDRGKRFHGRIRKGTRCVATMTTHRIIDAVDPKTGKRGPLYIASMWLEDINLPGFTKMANSKELENAHSGDKVCVEIVQIARSGYVQCNIIKYMN